MEGGNDIESQPNGKEDMVLSHQKPKRLKKSGNKVEPASYINLVTAILQLVTTIILFIETMR